MSVEAVNIADLGDTERAALTRLITSLADSKRLMGIRYSDWVLGAPSVEAGIAASSMTQDEWGHARLLYAMLKECGLDPKDVEHGRPDDAYASLDPLDAPFGDWAAVVAGMAVVDGALSTALQAFAEGRCAAARSRVPKMLAEEAFHVSLAAAWYRRLAASEGEGRTRLATATEAMLPPVLAWLGADDGPARTLAEAALTAPGAEQVAAFRDAVRDLLAEAGVDVDAAEPAAQWDETRGRGPGHPDPDALERARGDRNRTLLVE